MRDAWDEFASREPYFAVLTHPRYLSCNLDFAAETEFFRSGEEYVEDLFTKLKLRIAPRFSASTVLEYGCGPGRLLLPFARRAERVTGVDVSSAMLDAAHSHALRARLDNVELRRADEFERDSRTFDLVNCYLVLQRLAPRQGELLIRSLARRIATRGIGVFHLPYRTHRRSVQSLVAMMRQRVPAVNAVLNVARGKSPSFPFIPTYAYELNDVLTVLREEHLDALHVEFSSHGDVDTLLLFALCSKAEDTRAPEPQPVVVSEPPKTPRPSQPPGFVDVKALIASSSIEELNRKAEEYFSSLADWNFHLRKPFASVDDLPALLINVAVVLQGTRLIPGQRILDFGAGSGWLSRYLTQLGLQVFVLDVSPTALNIARELYRRQPPIGMVFEPHFLAFDGRHIDLEDASVDRVLCYDSFHHTINPDEILAEFARILRPGGIAGFSEPGPLHSHTARSQIEMKMYGQVESDVDIHVIEDTAGRLGFGKMWLAGFSNIPFHVSADDYEDLLARGETLARWAADTREVMNEARIFFLQKEGSEPIDSRRPEELRAEIEVIADSAVRADEEFVAHATVRNRGGAQWRESSETYGGVSLGCHLFDDRGNLLNYEYARVALPRALEPNEELSLTMALPAVAPGNYILEFDCVAANVTWFALVGSAPTRVSVISS
jgi:SAM-dependent methyltransferase